MEDKIKWLSNLRASCPTQPFTTTWEHEGVRMDLMVLNPIHRLLIADAPGWRSDKGRELNALPIQQVFAERTAKVSGGDRLTSNYAAVMVPYRSARPPVRSARLLEVDDDRDALAAVVELDGRTDYIISSLDQSRRQYGPVAMTGHFGFVGGSHAEPPGVVSVRRDPEPLRRAGAQDGVRSFFGAWAGPFDSSDNERIDADLAREYGGKFGEGEFCDAVSFLLMKREAVTEALTTDVHFKQAGLIRLLKP